MAKDPAFEINRNIFRAGLVSAFHKAMLQRRATYEDIGKVMGGTPASFIEAWMEFGAETEIDFLADISLALGVQISLDLVPPPQGQPNADAPVESDNPASDSEGQGELPLPN